MAAVRSLPDTAAAVLGDRSEEIPALLAAVKATTSDRAALAEWLDGFTRPDRAAAVAARSYWHHNGFAKLVLHAEDGFRIRMHIWPAGAHRLGETNPHGHRWNFASEVLCGDGLETEDYRVSPDGVEHIRYCYLGGLNSLAPIEHVKLQSTGRRSVRANEQHTVNTSVIHTVHPLGTDVVATLVVQSHALTEKTDVFCVPGKAVDEPIKAITPGEVAALVRSVVEARGDR
ncbi:hypothetical protein [Labedaea rhizosphaerae]|uniref:Cysteine dioxygenase type I n=1 Tax=Labedaea rhizosphaerae TaxID=598644 RepID=A0A4R6SEM0_LABRH|nr:hypothetical protein [Labedaea rhizosphaerae]TDP98174.1 hypothetical protein EV186_1031155 [Labedaea rhizosphaerae]